MAVHRVAKFKSAPTTRLIHADGVYRAPSNLQPAETVGKMRLFRKVVKEECADLLDVIGVGRMSSPIPSTRRI